MKFIDDLFQGLLRFKQDGVWIVDDYRTTVYGSGDSQWDALKDYIVSLIDFSELLVASETELRHVREFVRRVNARAEDNMEKTGKLEGSHYAAMQVELKVLEDKEGK